MEILQFHNGTTSGMTAYYGPPPTALVLLPARKNHAYAETIAVLVACTAAHCALAFPIAAFAFAQTGVSHVSDRHTAELRIAVMWQDFAAVATVIMLLDTKWPAQLARRRCLG